MTDADIVELHPDDMVRMRGGKEHRRRSKRNGVAQATARANRRTRQEFAMLINGARRKSVEGIIERGVYVIEAKQELDHGEFERMVREDLEDDPAIARKLRTIARHPVLANRENFHALPASVSTLYQLSFLKPETLQALIDDGTVNAKMTLEQASALRTGKSAAQRESERRQQAPSRASNGAASNGHGHDWSQHDEVEDAGGSHAHGDHLVDEIEGVLDPLRARIDAAKREPPAIRAMVVDALTEHVIAPAQRWIADLRESPVAQAEAERRCRRSGGKSRSGKKGAKR